MPIVIPWPDTLLALTWAGIGMAFGRGFGKKLDYEIQQDPYFKSLPPWMQGTLKRLLDCLHHWWIGGLLMSYFPHLPSFYWFGWGLFVDDIPDIPPRLIGLIKDWQSYIGDSDDE